MKTFFTTLLILILFALVLLGIETAAYRTHEILGDAGYTPLIQEIF